MIFLNNKRTFLLFWIFDKWIFEKKCQFFGIFLSRAFFIKEKRASLEKNPAAPEEARRDEPTKKSPLSFLALVPFLKDVAKSPKFGKRLFAF